MIDGACLIIAVLVIFEHFSAINLTNPNLRYTEIPRRINSANIFTSKGDDFDNLVLILGSFPPVWIIFGDRLSQIRASEMIFSGRLKSKQRVET